MRSWKTKQWLFVMIHNEVKDLRAVYSNDSPTIILIVGFIYMTTVVLYRHCVILSQIFIYNILYVNKC